MAFRVLSIILAGALLAGCATGPGFAVDGVDTHLTPSAASRLDADTRDSRVLWGGRILQVEPGAGHTTLEVVSFPLRNNQRPDANRGSEGRFLVHFPGYLEPEDYQAERLITVVGTIVEIRTGKVGEADYRYPVVRVDDLHLWPEQRDRLAEPQVRFGVGIGITR